MMKISPEKNLAFARQPKPILAKDVGRLVKAKPAGKRLEGAQLEVSRLVPAKGGHRIEAALDSANKATLRITNFDVGRHEFPPNIETKGIKTLGAKSRSFSKPLVTQASPTRPPGAAACPARAAEQASDAALLSEPSRPR